MNARIGSASALAARTAPELFLHCAIRTAQGWLIGDETALLVGFQGQESISEPFEYQLKLHGRMALADGRAATFDDVIGRPVTVGIECARPRPDMAAHFRSAVLGAEAAGPELALFNGVVASFALELPDVYRITMRPALWKLSLTNRYAIHAQRSICDAIAAVLSRHDIVFSMAGVPTDDNPARNRIQDWLQAGETDLEFVHRLMGKAHLHYYFVHTANGHELVFVNRAGHVYPMVSAEPLRYAYTAEDDSGLVQDGAISQYTLQRSLVSSSVRGVFTRQEAAWEADPDARFQSYSAASRDQPGKLPFVQYKIYQYGCSKDEVRHFTDATSRAMETAAGTFSGSSYCPLLRVGHQFAVSGANGESAAPVQPALDGRRFLLKQVKHRASVDGHYSNEFEAADAGGFLSAFALQETQLGSVLAKVVSRDGDPAAQDWRYYTPDYFDPETGTLADGAAAPLKAIGVYVRFSTAPEDSQPVWVKLAAGMQTVPEVGTTVTVARAQDESELPEIQGIVQSNGSMVIMPSTWSANTHVGSSYATSYGDGQSIRFGKNSKYDLERSVGIVDASYRSGRYRDTSYGQGASYNFACAETEARRAPDDGELYGPYAGAPDLLSASESFGSTYSRQYAQVASNFSHLGTSYSKSTVGRQESRSVIEGTSYSETTHGGDITSVTTINAASRNTTTQTGNSSNASTNNGDVDSSSIVTGTATSRSTHNIVVNLSQTGVQTSSSMTGVSNSNDVTGVANRNNVVGVSLDTSATGASTSVSMVGASAQVHMVGTSTSMSMAGTSTSISTTGASTNISNAAMSTTINMADVSTSVNIIGTNNTIEMVGPGFSFSERAAQPRIEVIDIRLTTIDILQIYL